MDGSNLLFEKPGRQSSERGSVPPSPERKRRPQPIRDSILAFLVEPRKAFDIARHIERRTCIATGHLRAMYAKGLVVRLGWGVWVRRDRCGGAPEQHSIRRDNPAQDRLLPLLQEPKTLDELALITGRSQKTLRAILRRMPNRATIERRDGLTFVVAAK